MKSQKHIFRSIYIFGFDIFKKLNHQFLPLIILSFFHSLLDSFFLILFVAFTSHVISGNLIVIESLKSIPFLYNLLVDLSTNNFLLLLLLVYIFLVSIYMFRGYISSKIASEYINVWRMGIVQSLLESKYEFYNAKNIKDIQSSINHEMSVLAAGFYEFQIILNTFIITSVYVIICLMVSVSITLSILLISFFIIFLSRRSVILSYNDNEKYNNQVSIFLSESINLIKNLSFIKATSSEIYFFKRLEFISLELKKYYSKTILRPIFQKCIMESLGILSVFLIIYVLLDLLNNSYLELGFILVIFLRLYPRLVSFNHSIINLTASLSVLNKNIFLVKELINFKELDIHNHLKSKLKFTKIIISNLNLSKNNIKILSDINLEIKFGEFIGIFGESGSGKSSVVNSILGLIGSSTILSIDNNDLLDHSQAIKLRSHIGYVSQDNFFMNSTITDNILWGLNFEYDKFYSVLNLVGINELIKKLPLGLETEVSSAGFTLSGGEKQKIALARALYRDPKILILDEATSALDKKSESDIMNAVYNLKNKLSCIIISHDYNNLHKCEKIYIIKNGQFIKTIT